MAVGTLKPSMVLILVLMEYALWLEPLKNNKFGDIVVLILVLMEYALWHFKKKLQSWNKTRSLNPCSNGICSLTIHPPPLPTGGGGVLILVLMEYALWPRSSRSNIYSLHHRLNPCSNGICSLTIEPQCQSLFTFFSLNPCSNGICSLTSHITGVEIVFGRRS